MRANSSHAVMVMRAGKIQNACGDLTIDGARALLFSMNGFALIVAWEWKIVKGRTMHVHTMIDIVS